MLDRDNHKRGCVAVKGEEQRLRHMPGDVFENEVGHFWGIMGTRPYAMLHHFGSAGGRVDVVQAASGYAPALSLGQHRRPGHDSGIIHPSWQGPGSI